MLIDTKLRLPSLAPGTMNRLELLDQLGKVSKGRLAIVSAPTGFGKSTLLAQWAARLQAQREAVGWLTIEASDNELGRFASYLVAAIRKADPACCGDLPGLLASSPIFPVETVLTTLVNDLSARSRDLYLVIDDFHYLGAPAIIQFLEALLGYAPPSFHLVLGTRSQVPFQLAGMRARGQLVSIDESQLRFSLTQTESYLNQSRTLNMSAADIVTLHHRTEGWIAGLHLASLSLADGDDRAEFLDRFNGAEGDIADFLIHEVLDRQPPEVLDFLLCTAILERFSAPLADALTGARDSTHLIAMVEAANLFLIPLDRDRTWFRYHALFTDLLRALLARRDPARLARLHLRAAQWLSGAGMTAEAVHHALAAPDGDFAATLVEACCMPLIRQRNIAQVRDWLARLPDEIIAQRPRLQLAQVWSHFHTSQPLEGARILRKVRDALIARNAAGSLTRDEVFELSAELLVLTAGVASAADHSSTAVRLAERALREVPAQMHFLRGVVGNVAGFSHYTRGNLQAARLVCLQARDAHSAGHHAFGVLYSDLILGLTDKAAGNLVGALEHFSRATRLARASDGPGSYSEAMVGIFEAEILYERNDLAAAERLVIQHRPIIEECGLVVHSMTCKLLGARLAAAAGQVDAALAVLEAAERQGLRNRYRRLFSSALHERVKLLLASGEPQYARLILSSRKIDEAWLASAQSHRPACEMEHLAAARVLICENRPEAALRLLDPLAATLRRDGRHRRLAQVRAVTAVAALRAGNGLGAVAAASDAVTLSMPGGAVRTLIEEGAPFQEALGFARDRIALWRDTETGPGHFVATLMGKVTGAAPATGRPAPFRPADFSPRESEIVRLLCEGMGNRDIGANLSMAPDTVKWHLKNIFGKLGVANRTHAVLRLQEIGLAAATRKGG